MKLIPTTKFQLTLSEADRKQLSSSERIEQALTDPDSLSYDIWDGDARVGFAMLCPFEGNGFFLWNFAIDSAYQNQHYGQRALRELLALLKQEPRSLPPPIPLETITRSTSMRRSDFGRRMWWTKTASTR